MTVYVLRDKKLVPKEQAGPPKSSGPFLWRDHEGFVSPLSDPRNPEWVEGRRARREHMKRHNVREVDPSERPKG